MEICKYVLKKRLEEAKASLKYRRNRQVQQALIDAQKCKTVACGYVFGGHACRCTCAVGNNVTNRFRNLANIVRCFTVRGERSLLEVRKQAKFK
ncbi:hypothetical protein NPIL_475831 [Nephila pilipes]|uniref:Uncharacterized protein n=1 Tax=Nephila pilipes TaxID=299642 RepID=A0A8X6TRL8_NEPPI|nr:hypothetical protein NPIL_475831 [Nephila pilipes]